MPEHLAAHLAFPLVGLFGLSGPGRRASGPTDRVSNRYRRALDFLSDRQPPPPTSAFHDVAAPLLLADRRPDKTDRRPTGSADARARADRLEHRY